MPSKIPNYSRDYYRNNKNKFKLSTPLECIHCKNQFQYKYTLKRHISQKRCPFLKQLEEIFYKKVSSFPTINKCHSTNSNLFSQIQSA